jgi:hypothetical protein
MSPDRGCPSKRVKPNGERTSALPPPWLPQRPHELTEDRDNPLTARAVRRPGCRPQRRAFKGRMTRVDIDRRCTTPGRRAREVGGRAPFSSLGEEAAQQRDGAAGTPLPDQHRGMRRLYNLVDDCPRTEPIGADVTRRHCQPQSGSCWA